MTTFTDTQRQLLEQRYGTTQPHPQQMQWTPQIEALLRHKSVRTFTADPLPAGTLEAMVAAAQSASNSSALNQWSVVAVSDPLLKQRLADTIARTVPVDRLPVIEEAPLLLLWVADLSRGADLTRTAGREPVVYDYLDSLLMATIDASLAAQNAAVAAESLGLGLVYLGVMRNAAQAIAGAINLPPYSFVTFGMAVGHPDPSRAGGLRPRPAQPVVLHHNRYDPLRYRDYLAQYEAAYRDFRTQQRMADKSWQASVIASATSMAYMGGREQLRETVIARGFNIK